MEWYKDFISIGNKVDYEGMREYINANNVTMEQFEKILPYPFLIGREVYESDLRIEDGSLTVNEFEDTSTAKLKLSYQDMLSEEKAKRVIPNVSKQTGPEQGVYALLMNPSNTPNIDGECLIGKGDKCDVIIKDSAISRKHARVYNREDRFYIEDLNSTNGTKASLVNVKPGTPRILMINTKISFGRLVFVFYPSRLFYSCLAISV